MKCTIEIYDEVNCRILGLEEDNKVRKKLYDHLSFKLVYSHNLLSVKLGRWDGCKHFCTIGAVTYINLIPKLIPILDKYGYDDIGFIDHRPAYSFDFPSIDENYLSEFMWPAGHRFENLPIILDEHQLRLINEFLVNQRGIIVASTGSGKTICTAALAKIVQTTGRTITIVPSNDLVNQTCETFQLIGLDVGTFDGSNKDWQKTHTICTWQSLNVLDKKSKDALSEKDIQEFLKDVVCVMGDECHGAAADALFNLLKGPFKNVPIRWGVSGTLPKEEIRAISLEAVIGPHIATITAKELQDKGFLSKSLVNVLKLFDDKKFENYQDEKEYLDLDPDRIKFVSRLLNSLKESGNTLILVNRIDTGKQLEKLLEKDGAVFVQGSTKTKDRKKEYDEVKVANSKIIIATYGVASVGIDVPRIFNLVLFEPGKSFIKVIQSIGRGLRRARDKDFVQIYDICNKTKYSQKHLRERIKYYKEMEYDYDITLVKDWKE